MRKLIRLFVLASVVASLFGFGYAGATADTAFASASGSLSLSLSPSAAGAGFLAGRIDGVDGSMAFVTIAVTLHDGTSRSLNVNSSTNWNFSFGVMPADGWVGISITEHPVPMPSLVGLDWDYGYYHGFYYAYPLGTPWNGYFPGYTWAPGYGWGYYPFGYYVWAHHLNSYYGFPYYWTYAPVQSTPQYVYYGIGGLNTTYYSPSFTVNQFGSIYRPYYLATSGNAYSYVKTYGPNVTVATSLATAPKKIYVAQSLVAPIQTRPLVIQSAGSAIQISGAGSVYQSAGGAVQIAGPGGVYQSAGGVVQLASFRR